MNSHSISPVFVLYAKRMNEKDHHFFSFSLVPFLPSDHSQSAESHRAGSVPFGVKEETGLRGHRVESGTQTQPIVQSKIGEEPADSFSKPVSEGDAVSSSDSGVQVGKDASVSSNVKSEQESLISETRQENSVESGRLESSHVNTEQSPVESQQTPVESQQSPIESQQSPIEVQQEDTSSANAPVDGEEEEERNPALSKYSKRFRFSRHKLSLDEIEDASKTYYPKDHMREGNLWAIRKKLAEEEKDMLELLRPALAAPLERYEEMTEYLSHRDATHKYVSEEELRALQQLQGKEQAQLRKKLDARLRLATQKDAQAREQRRKGMMARMQRVGEGPVCDGCLMTDRLRLSRRRSDDTLVRKFVGNEERFDIFNSTHYKYPSADTPFSISAICVTTYNRLSLLPQLLYRWHGPLVIVLNGAMKYQDAFLSFIATHYLPTRLTLLLYLIGVNSPEKGQFPVNKLRNLGIRNIVTTHFQILDMDLWPTTDTYETMLKLPAPLRSGRNAVIFPVFFFDRKSVLTRCDSLAQCSLLALEYCPRNKTELRACLLNRNCLSSKKGIRTHLYVMPEWYSESSVLLYRIQCFVADFQEPYVLLRYDADTPLFDERFVNYGYNKVQLFEHLRAQSYQFFIWNTIFAMDLPHPDSKFRKNYITGLKVRDSPMREVYSVFQSELNEKYAANKPSRVCRTIQRRYYSTVLYLPVCPYFTLLPWSRSPS